MVNLIMETGDPEKLSWVELRAETGVTWKKARLSGD